MHCFFCHYLSNMHVFLAVFVYKAMLIMLQLMNCSNSVVLCGLERVCIQIHVGIHRELEEYHGN